MVPVVVFYILKIRMRRVPVSTVLFWRQIFEDKRPRSLWQKPRHLISLLVQLAFLALVAAALADLKAAVELARRLIAERQRSPRTGRAVPQGRRSVLRR